MHIYRRLFRRSQELRCQVKPRLDFLRSGFELGMFLGVEVTPRDEYFGGFRRPLRDAMSCSLPYPPVELAGYFREPLRGMAFKLGSFVVRGSL